MILLKNQDEIANMKQSGAILAQVFAAMQEAIRPGVSTLQLDQIAREIIEAAGARPSFLHYGDPPFSGSICASVNDVVVHGVPSASVILKEGDIISIDVGACLNGWHSDACRTYPVGKISSELETLIRVTEECFFEGLAYAKPGLRLGDLQAAIQKHAESHGFGVVRELTGHGIGRSLHEEPNIPNYGKPGRGIRLEEGMVLAVEPMITLGSPRIYIGDDDWSIFTVDSRPAAHYENTFAILADGPMILTA